MVRTPKKRYLLTLFSFTLTALAFVVGISAGILARSYMLYKITSFVNLTAVSCVHDYNGQNIVFNTVYQPIIAHAKPKMPILAFHLLNIAAFGEQRYCL